MNENIEKIQKARGRAGLFTARSGPVSGWAVKKPDRPETNTIKIFISNPLFGTMATFF
jgi:hypothetical protein